MLAHVIDSLTNDPPKPDVKLAFPLAAHHDLAATATDAMVAVGSLVLDTNGIIRFCSAAVAWHAGAIAAGLIGRPIKSLLPQLPFNHDTPGYNVAYAMFSFASGVSYTLLLAKVDGSQMTVDASLSSFKINEEHLFCLELRYHPQATILLNELHASDSKAALTTETAVITDADDVINYVNPVFDALTGFCSEEVLGCTPAILKPEMHDDNVYRGLLDMIRAGEDGYTLLKRADMTKYQAKHNGGNGYRCWSSHRKGGPCASANASEADARTASATMDKADRQSDSSKTSESCTAQLASTG